MFVLSWNQVNNAKQTPTISAGSKQNLGVNLITKQFKGASNICNIATNKMLFSLPLKCCCFNRENEHIPYGNDFTVDEMKTRVLQKKSNRFAERCLWMLQMKQEVKKLCCRLPKYPKEFHLAAVEFQGIRQE